MKPKYNRALDLIACAADAFQRGDMNESSKLMTRAFKAPDCAEAVEAMLQHNELAVRASSDDGIDAEFQGEELRIEPDENKPREVQTARARARARATASASTAKARAQNYFAGLQSK